MKITTLTLLLISTVLTTNVFSQKDPAKYSDKAILTDTLSTLFIPTRYNEDFFSSNKIALWNDYYANIIVYNFKTDTYKKLFDKDTFISRIRVERSGYPAWTSNLTTRWVFLMVKTRDTNNNGRIDEKDPSVLFAVSVDGNTLKQLTDETENVVGFDNFSGQGFLMINIQRDSDNDKSFNTDDKEFYFRKVDLADLTLGKPVEIN